MIDHVHIGGLDLSTKNIGYAAPNGTTHSIPSDKIAAHPTPMQIAARCHLLRERLARTIRTVPPQPTLIVIEGPFYMHKNTSARLDELRGVIRVMLIDWPHGAGTIEFVEVPPKSLKLFATGKATADKTTMRHAACSRVGHSGSRVRPPRNDDEADAWWLRQMGRVAEGLEVPLAGYEVEAIRGCGVPRWAEFDPVVAL